ncbi:MAG: hypothetical protein V3T84_07390 [Phycisphaerales bacterium]
MNDWRRIVLFVGVLAVLGWLGYLAAQNLYFEEKADHVSKIDSYRSFLKDAKAESRRRRELDADLQEIVNRTLGADRETVDHQLRTRLNRIGEELGISGLSVGTGQARKLQSPARNEFGRTHRALRDEIDFVELEGWITGEATFEAALRLVYRIDAEPWLKHLDQVRLQPKDNGDRFGVTVRLTTLFLPRQVPSEPMLAAYDTSAFDPYLALTRSNLFRVPPQGQSSPPTPSAVAATSQDQWTLTGVASGPQGLEVWLLNLQTGESRRLAVGETLRDLVLVGAVGETAEFRRDQQQFTVSVGQRLSQRSPLQP